VFCAANGSEVIAHTVASAALTMRCFKPVLEGEGLAQIMCAVSFAVRGERKCVLVFHQKFNQRT
jgi:hypothetical protein